MYSKGVMTNLTLKGYKNDIFAKDNGKHVEYAIADVECRTLICA